jgi:CelD/BcsL family acetyltransferase involved in cellulose biosynthesis
VSAFFKTRFGATAHVYAEHRMETLVRTALRPEGFRLAHRPDLAGAGRTVVIARTFEQIEEIRPAWQVFDLPTVHHDIDFFLAKLRSRPAVVRPHVILVRCDGEPEAIAIGRLESDSLQCKLGYKTVYRPRMQLLVMRPGFLFRGDSNPPVRPLVAELMDSLARGEADAVSFHGLDAEPLGADVRGPCRLPLCREGFVVRERHCRLTLPDSMDTFLGSLSRHARGEMRGLRNRLPRKYGGRLSMRTFASAEELDRLLDDLRRVDSVTYQRALHVGSASAEEERQLMLLGVSRGWFRAYVLYIDEEPVCYWSGFLYRGTFSGAKTGYDPAYRNDRVGTYLLMSMIEDLCADDAAQSIDYGWHDAEYKRRFSNSCVEEVHPLIFAPTLTGIRVNAARTAITAADRCGKWMLQRSGALAPVRKRWREHALLVCRR